MDPKLKLTDVKKDEPTIREIVEEQYKKSWNRAKEHVNQLCLLQKSLLTVLPNHKQLLPKDLNDLADEIAQIHLQTFFLDCALFNFAEAVYKHIIDRCNIVFGKYIWGQGYDDKELNDILDWLDCISLEDLAKDHVMGLHRLSILVNQIQPPYFNVIGQLTWSDLMGIIERSGLCDYLLLQAAINGSHPTCASVGELRVDEDKIY